MQPFTGDRKRPMPDWFKYGAGSAYPKRPTNFLFDDIIGKEDVDAEASRAIAASKTAKFSNKVQAPVGRTPADQSLNSVVIVRNAAHPENLSGSKETLVPTRFLYGLLPHCIMIRHRFWRDETNVLRGYPLKLDLKSGEWQPDLKGEYILLVVFRKVEKVQCTGLRGRTLRVTRVKREALESEYRRRQRLASFIEEKQLIFRRKKKKKEEKKEEKEEKEEKDFNPDAAVSGVVSPRGGFAFNNNTNTNNQAEGVWHWAGMTDEEDEAWAQDDDDDDDDDSRGKTQINAEQLSRMNIILGAANWSEEKAVDALKRLAMSEEKRRFGSLNELADAVSASVPKEEAEEEKEDEEKKDKHVVTLEEDRVRDGESWFDAVDSNSADALLNLAYAPRGSKLYVVFKREAREYHFSYFTHSHARSLTESTHTLEQHEHTLKQHEHTHKQQIRNRTSTVSTRKLLSYCSMDESETMQ